MIYAVNYHTMPVFSGRDFPLPRLIWAHWIVFMLGICVTTVGLAEAWSALTFGGLALELAGSLLFIANTITLFRQKQLRVAKPSQITIIGQPRTDRLGTHATKLSGLCLPLALSLLLSVQARWVDASWWLAAEHLLTLGWVMLMIVGVAYHLLPRFSGSGIRGHLYAIVQIRCHVAALALIVVALGGGSSILFALGGSLMALSLSLFAWTIWPTLTPINQVISVDS
jgi:hypothetical protein